MKDYDKFIHPSGLEEYLVLNQLLAQEQIKKYGKKRATQIAKRIISLTSL